jgi:Protein of unknown function (DUF1759)
LREALKGEALSHVLSILSYSTKASEAIEALSKIYGRPEVLVLRLTQKLLATVEMKSETDAKLKDFSLALSSYVQSMKALKRPAELKNAYVQELLVSKLHITQYREWKKLQRQNAETDLEDLSSFLITIVEEIPIDKFTNHGPKGDQKRTDGRVNAHHESEGRRGGICCFNCQGSHVLTKCEKFRNAAVKEHEQIIRDKKVCMSCLSSTEHAIKNCPTKRECGINGCVRSHNRLLHRKSDEQKKETSNGGGSNSGNNWRSGSNPNASNSAAGSALNANAGTYQPPNQGNSQSSSGHVGLQSEVHHLQSHSQSKSVLYKILPVKLASANGKKFVTTFAFLDDGSSLTLIEKEIFEELGLNGEPETLNIQWTGGIKRQEESQRTKVKISGVKSKKSFHLKDVHAISGIDLPSQSVSAAKLKKHFNYLRDILLR